MGFCVGIEYLDAFQVETMKSIDIYFGIFGVSFRWL